MKKIIINFIKENWLSILVMYIVTIVISDLSVPDTLIICTIIGIPIVILIKMFIHKLRK